MREIVREAAAGGARVVIETPCFWITGEPRHLALARPFEAIALVARFAALARELSVVLPVSFYERARPRR